MSLTIDHAIVTAYRDLRWTLRQCSYAFGPSVTTIRCILDRAGAPRRSQRERHTGRPSPAELATRLRYAQRGLPAWTEYGLMDGCDDPFVAAEIIDLVFGQPAGERIHYLPAWDGHGLPGADGDLSGKGAEDPVATAPVTSQRCGRQDPCTWAPWAAYRPAPTWDRAFLAILRASQQAGRDGARLRSECGYQFYIAGPCAAGWWYARPRGNGAALGWCARSPDVLADQIYPYHGTQITPARGQA